MSYWRSSLRDSDGTVRDLPRPHKGRQNGVGLFVGGCLLFLIGAVVGIIGLIVGALFYIGSAPGSQPLPPNNTNAGYDIKTDIAQSYLNSEVSTALSQNQPNIPFVTVKRVALDLLDGNQIKVTSQLTVSVLGIVRDVNLSATDQVSVSNGNIALRQVGDAAINNAIQIDTRGVVNVLNDTIIAPQINTNIKNITIDGRKLQLADASVRKGFLSVSFSVVR